MPLNDTIAKDAIFDFEYINVSGRIYNDRSIPRPDGVQQLTYQEINGNYELKIGLIPKASGVYVLVFGNGLSAARSKDRSCEKASFNITLEDTNQHFYLLYNWDPDALFYNDGKSRVYYFKVK